MNSQICIFLMFSLVAIVIMFEAQPVSGKQGGNVSEKTQTFTKRRQYNYNRTMRPLEHSKISKKFFACVANCFKSLECPEQFFQLVKNTSQDVFREENSTNIGRLFNVKLFDWFCEFAKNRSTCVSGCPESRFKTFFFEVTEPTNYACNASEFLRYVKCYEKVYRADVNGCDRNEMCGAYKYSAYLNVLKHMDIFNNSQEELSASEKSFLITNFTQNLCEYIACGNRCRRDELIKECGTNEANQILVQLYRKLIQQIKTIVNFFIEFMDGEKIIFLDQCDATLKID